MYGLSNYDLPFQIAPTESTSAAANPQPSSANSFLFANCLSQPLALYNQLNHQINASTTPNYVSTPSPGSINNLGSSIQQQFHPSTGFCSTFTGATPTTPIINQQPFFQRHQPSTSTFCYGFDSLHNLDDWRSSMQWPNNAISQASRFHNDQTTTDEYYVTQNFKNSIPQTPVGITPNPSVPNLIFPISTNVRIPRNALKRTVVLLKRQNIHTMNWTNKSSKYYFKNWLNCTFNIDPTSCDIALIIHRPDYIIGFFFLEVETVKYLVKHFADGQLKNDVMLKSASDFIVQMMRIYRQRTGNLSCITSVEDAFLTLFNIKKEHQLASANIYPPCNSYQPWKFENS